MKKYLKYLERGKLRNYNCLLKFTLLTVCIIYFVYAVSPIFPRKFTIKTYSDLELSLCRPESIKKNVLSKSTKCPTNGIVTADQGGRLGNQIWEYASVFVVAKETGLQPYIPQCIIERLEVMFDNLSVPSLKEIGHCPVQGFVSINNIEEYLSNHSIILDIYNEQPELVSTYFEDVIKELSIKKELLEESQKILHSVMKSFNRTFNTFIGVHIRRTDYINHITNYFKAKATTTNFYKSAIEYFDKKYKNSVFIVVSDDPVWCSEQFKSTENVYVASKIDSSPELDLAILSACNHSIIDYGTYGQWGALLAGGETIYFGVNQNYSSDRLSKCTSKWHTL